MDLWADLRAEGCNSLTLFADLLGVTGIGWATEFGMELEMVFLWSATGVMIFWARRRLGSYPFGGMEL